MNDATPAGDSPVSTQPEDNPDLGMPGDSPLADAPQPEAPTLAPDSTEPAGDDAPPAAAESPPDPASIAAPPLAAAEPPPDEVATEPPPDEAATEPPDAAKRPEPRRLSRGEREMVERVRQRFAACGRCGYLYADLYLLLGEEALQSAAVQARDGWLRLEGDERLRPLLVNAFGVRLDLGYESMDGACPECRRRFVFATLDDGHVRLKLRA